MTKIEINGRKVGTNPPPFVIAEIGMNHNGDLALGKEMITMAAESGTDAVKFQSFQTDQFLSDKVGSKDQYREYELSRTDHEELQAEARSCDVTFLSTPFDRASVDMLVDLDVPCFKIASSDLTNYPFLEYIAEKGKPIILSTGYASFSEVAQAIETIEKTGNDQLVVLHCLSSYPAPPEEMNLKAIRTLREAFNLPTGLSDHTQATPVASVTATAFGASVIEKHFTTDNSLSGFDHGMSENPETFSEMVKQVQTTYDALGTGDKQPQESELENRTGARRSLFWESSFSASTSVNEQMVTALRPGDGIPPEQLEIICESELSTDVNAGDQITYEQLTWSTE